MDILDIALAKKMSLDITGLTLEEAQTVLRTANQASSTATAASSVATEASSVATTASNLATQAANTYNGLLARADEALVADVKKIIEETAVSSLTIKTNGNLQIGGTTLNENQLQRLLALLT